jgi:putative transposase
LAQWRVTWLIEHSTSHQLLWCIDSFVLRNPPLRQAPKRYDRFCYFGHIDNDAMILNQYGQIAFDEWMKLPERYPNFELDVFQIMPNHIHAIISLTNPAAVGATLAVAPDVNAVAPDVNDERAGVNPAPTGTGVSDIVGAYKSLVSNGCLKIFKSKNEIMGKLWQRNYHEHIIRNEQSYQRIAAYIMNNPANWAEDKFYSGKIQFFGNSY